MILKDALRACKSLVHSEDWVKAWHATNEVLNEYPDDPQALYLMGLILREQGHVGLALPVLGKALATEQKVPNLWMNYGATLHDLNHWDDAIRAFSVVHGMLPNDPMPPANISASHVQMGKWHDAINWADKAFKLDGENYIAHISAGIANLALGRWKDAWKHSEYLYGNHLAVRVYNAPENEEPLWDGTKGQCVVVQCDQGLGDIIMFSQMIPQLQADCREVIIECAERLVPLMRRTFPECHVYGTLKSAGQGWSLKHKIDAHTQISFLGRWYRNTDADFTRKAYLQPDPKLLAKWQKWLSQFPKPWRGVAWRGGIQRTLKHIRSIDLDDLKPVIDLPGTNIDLSYHDSSKEIERSGFDIKRPLIDVNNYDDTVALIAALDDVVTVTTTAAHVCGALGRKACVLVPDVPTWRYAYRADGGERLIWYPADSVRLFRRNHGELDWSHAIRRVVNVIGGRSGHSVSRAA
jgi:tetratricopeptide (TPR) repeat protein